MKYIIFSLFFSSTIIFAQSAIEKCKLEKSELGSYRVDAEDVKCIAKNSEKPNSVFYTFASWCAPCIYHLDTFMSIEKNYNADLYVLLMDVEKMNMVYQAQELVKKDYPNAHILIIKDVEGRGKNKKYKKFLDDITPSNFLNIKDMSKYIVLNKQGEVQLVTTYKDDDSKDWRDDSGMVKKLVLPLLEKKNLLKFSN